MNREESIKLLFRALQFSCKDKILMLQTQYWNQRRKGLLDADMSEEAYVLEHLGEALAEESKDFHTEDQERRVSAVLPLFCKERCKELENERYPSGYAQLDAAMNGGFAAGVHVLGAASSLGKSTFLLQMAAQMAAQGLNVIYVSLEMGRKDLVAKLVSMYTYVITDGRCGKTMAELTCGCEESFKDQDWDIVGKAADTIAAFGDRLTILDERVHGMSMSDISEYVFAYMREYGTVPILMIDYLQILARSAGMERCTDKQVVDLNIAALRGLSAQYDMPVIVVSSLNRDSYAGAVDFASCKESGSIEYSCDTLLGLHLRGAEQKGFDAMSARAAEPRQLTLAVLKQRYGASGIKIDYNFHARYNYFSEVEYHPRPRNATRNRFDV